MKRYPTGRIRNLALVSHGGAGKTSLAEAMLFAAGATDRLGRTEDGNTVMDYDPEETRRKVSINLGIAPLEWQEHKVNLLDTPGYFDFVGDVKAALRVAEGALVVVDAVAGVEVGTELAWDYASAAGVARLVVISRMDRENANFGRVLGELQDRFGRGLLPLALPMGSQAGFFGLVDVVHQKAYRYEGGKPKEVPVPADLQADLASARDALAEQAAEVDDELTLKFLEGEPLTDEEIRRGLMAGVQAGRIVPVLPVSAAKNIGTVHLLNTVVELLPAPDCVENAPTSALVFKTISDPFVGRLSLFKVCSGVLKADSTVVNTGRDRTERLGHLSLPKGKAQLAVHEVGAGDIGAVAKLNVTQTGDTLCDPAHPVQLEGVTFPAPVYRVAVHPKAKGDEEKIGQGLHRLTEEDPTFQMERNPVTFETVITGMGDLHLDVMMERLKRKFGVEATTAAPRLAYKETVRGSAKAEYKHKKQSGGRGQYGHAAIELEPLYDGQEFEFVDRIFAGAIPLNFRPAVEKGVREAMVEGVFAGYPVTGVRVTLLEGSYHDVDSSEMAFKIAGSMAFKKAFLESRPILLEPVMAVEVTVPDQYMGDIMGDVTKKRGKVLGMEQVDGLEVVRAMIPQAEMARYALDLRSLTQGRGRFTMRFDHLEEVPPPIAAPIIAAHDKHHAEAQ